MSSKGAAPVFLAVNDPAARSALITYFAVRGDRCETVAGTGAAERLLSLRPAVVVADFDPAEPWFPSLRKDLPHATLIAVAENAAVGFAAARAGAAELLLLPLDPHAMTQQLNRLFAPKDAVAGTSGAEAEPSSPRLASAEPELMPSTGRMRDILDTINKVATTSATVLIRGESGVGKEIVARMIYGRSERQHQPFVKVNCAAIPDDLLESELFGFEQGAFTGALRAKPGKFELANGGTIFLDEIGEMHPMLQAKLLHVLQDGEFSRLGAKHDVAVDVRVICATNKVLEQRVAEGLFREDLFYRINVVTVHVPPLRERRSEIPGLVEHFLEKYSEVYRRQVLPLGEEAMQMLVGYSWPGNIRELENLCKRYVIVGEIKPILRELAQHQSPALRSVEAVAPSPPRSLLEIGREAAWKAEKLAIEQMLEQTRWNRKEAARRLNVSYKALLNKIGQMEAERHTGKENS